MIINPYIYTGPQPVPAAFPEYLGFTTSRTSTQGTSHSVQLPAEIDEGDRIILQISFAFGGTVTAPSALTNIVTSDATQIRGRVYFFDAEGDEGGETLSFSTSSAARMTAIVHRIRAGTFQDDVWPEVSVGSASTADPDAPSLTASWGKAQTLWIPGYMAIGQGTLSSYPYPDNQAHVQSTDSADAGAAFCECASCTVELDEETVDPETVFNRNVISTGVPFTIAVSPIDVVKKVEFVAASGSDYVTSTATSVEVPVEAQVGDLIMLFVMHRDDLTNVPSGFALVETDGPIGDFNQRLSVYSKTAEIGDVSATLNLEQDSSQRFAAHVQVYRSDTTPQIVASGIITSSTGNDNVSVQPTGQLQIGIACETYTSASSMGTTNNPPSGYTLTTPNSVPNNRLACAYKRLNPGESAGGNFTRSTAETDKVAFACVLAA